MKKKKKRRFIGWRLLEELKSWKFGGERRKVLTLVQEEVKWLRVDLAKGGYGPRLTKPGPRDRVCKNCGPCWKATTCDIMDSAKLGTG